MTNFLPESYEVPQSNAHYMRLQQGENKFRFLSRPIVGWLDWKDDKPFRYTMKNKPEKPFNADKPLRHFWAMIVFDYADSQVKILEITQATIQKGIETLAKDSDWGAPFGYDLKITKKGQDKSTEYAVSPSPKKQLTDAIKQAAKDRPINLEALYKGGDPFNIQNGEQTEVIIDDLPF